MDRIYLYLKMYDIDGEILNYNTFFYYVFVPLILKYVELKKKYEEITFIIGENLGKHLRILLELPIDIKLKFNMKDYEELDVNVTFLIPVDVKIISQDFVFLNKSYWSKIINYDDYLNINNFMMTCIKNNDIFAFDNYSNDVLYIKKKDNIENEEELIKLLKNNYKSVRIIDEHFEYLPIFTKYLIFNSAKLVISQCKYELSNIIFMNSNSVLVQIEESSENELNIFYRNLADIFKIKKYKFLTDKKDIKIDGKEFIKFIKEVINKENLF